jgi:hypothetical protein
MLCAVAVIPLGDSDDQPRLAWERWAGIAVVAACVILVFGVSDHGLSLWRFWDPQFGALFRNTTTNGGDMGAHVWWPWFMREHWFWRFRLAGWAPDWYDGFPVGQFYFPLPALLVVALDVFIPYNVAFKLVTVSGPLLLPVSAYVFGRGMRARWPMPPAFAVAATVFLFNTRENWQIYGGNLASNLAGEFSYTLAIALCLFFFAALARTLDTGKRPWLPALLFAMTALSHIVVITFALVGALFIWLTRRPWRTYPVVTAVVAVGGLLAALWWVPLLLRQPYTQSMRYEKVIPGGTFRLPGFVGAVLPSGVEHAIEGVIRGVTWTDGKSLTLWAPTWMWILAAIAIVGGAVYRRRTTLVLALLTVTFAFMFVQWPADQHVWNTRYLPLYFLSLSLLCGAGAAEIANLVRLLALRAADWVHEGDLADARDEVWAEAVRRGETPLPADTPLPEEWTPPEHLQPAAFNRRRTIIGAIACTFVIAVGAIWGIAGAYAARNYLPFWSKWNYEGYEAKPAWKEFDAIIQTMDKLPPGRALWEPSGDIDKYGTTLALELLPYFTDGRIDSMEGLYFESSATTDYHFLTVSELTADGKASNPVRGLVYGSIADFDRGVEHMQMLGVKYYMAQSSQAKQRASDNTNLRLVAQVPDYDGQAPKGWNIYQVLDAPMVAGMAREPVVAHVHGGTSSSCFDTPKPAPPQHDPGFPNAWECATAPWWMNSSLLDTPYAQSGPKQWRRVDIRDLASVKRRALPKVTVSHVVTDVDKIAFHVSRTGVPVVVKSSYFPNWQASGAEGPYRLAPNLMVVIPKSHDVVLSYGVTGVDWLGRLGTLLGVAGLVLLVLWKPKPSRRATFDDEADAVVSDDEPPPGGETPESGTKEPEPTPALP